ncbi:tRNA guanosine(34) transglycosylase Tgt [Patescibacteria group bacterium]|nr:tRNA guanosine(34) transglycosylase Tgt [Patescibacteria group bacterium]MCL5114432.1 tRNA guanosine(34) transglycosylase Tgt [Patescibacteria group bacterium]
MFGFKIVKKDKDSRARVGVIETPHGIVETPAYTMVGTNAAVRTLSSEDVAETKTQIVIVNTYHMWKGLGDKLEVFEGLHAKMKWQGPLMTDSGGFQVFSFGFGREHKIGKIAQRFPESMLSRGSSRSTVELGIREADSTVRERRLASVAGAEEQPATRDNVHSGRSDRNLVKITEEGVYFYDGEERFLNPEISMHIQEKLGADIIFAFDECTSPLNDYEYTKGSMVRTHRWALRSLAAKKREDQALYGIVQGGEFEDLRKESARVVGSMAFDGFGIGGSFGKEEMLDVLDWVTPLLPEGRPRHLLGIGRIEDIFAGVERGIDTFDCVIPTREARHGSLWTKGGRFDVRKGKYAEDKGKIENDCLCPVCLRGISRKELHDLFKAKDQEAGRLATIHNVWFFNDLMAKIRKAIMEGTLKELKEEYLEEMKG